MTVWERRDLPVLNALAMSDHEHVKNGFLSVDAGATDDVLGLGLDGGEVYAAVMALLDVGYVEVNDVRLETGPGAMFLGLRVTGRGQQALGAWPLFDEIASPETLAALLDRLAEEAPTEEEARNAHAAAEYVRTVAAGSLRAMATGALAQLIRVGLGLG